MELDWSQPVCSVIVKLSTFFKSTNYKYFISFLSISESMFTNLKLNNLPMVMFSSFLILNTYLLLHLYILICFNFILAIQTKCDFVFCFSEYQMPDPTIVLLVLFTNIRWIRISTGCSKTTARIIPGVPEKVSPQIQNKKCFSPRVNIWECKKMSLVKVIDLRVIHLLIWWNLTKNILESSQRLTASQLAVSL